VLVQFAQTFFKELLAEAVVELKVGAQVILVKNAPVRSTTAATWTSDPLPSQQQRLVNGSRGVVTELVEVDVRIRPPVVRVESVGSAP
jgi:hypothetical protein